MSTLIENTRWERSAKAEFQRSHDPLKQAVEAGTAKGYDFDGLSQDLFSALYQYSPKFPEGAPTSGTAWQAKILQELKGMPEFSDLRSYGTRGDSFQSGLGSTILSQNFAKTLQPMADPNPDDLQREIEALEDFAQQNPEDPKAQAALDRAAQAKSKLPEATGAWSQAADQLDPSAIRQGLRRAIAAAKQEIEEINEAANAYGYGTEPGKDGYSTSAAKLALAKKIQSNPKLKEIADLAGRFRREARAIQSAKKQPGPDELTDIETGSALNRLLPSELGKISNRWRKLEFFKNYLENSLLQYRLEEREKLAKGPLVVCIDNSGSMAGPREVWSKAVMMGLCAIAQDQNRAFTVIHFSNVVDKVYTFEPKKVDPNIMLECCEYFSGGGTNFDDPLSQAIDIIEQKKGANPALKAADIVLVSDGACQITTADAIKQRKAATGAKLFSILIGGDCQDLREISDSYTSLSDLADDSQAKETVFSL